MLTSRQARQVEKLQKMINRDKLCDALRSGKFTQGIDFMLVQTITGAYEYCCLGVACEISGMGNWSVLAATKNLYGTSVQQYEASQVKLPENVRDFYGFRTVSGVFWGSEWSRMVKHGIISDAASSIGDAIEQNSQFASLTELNDLGVDFNTIANVIEFEPKGLIE